MAVDFCLEQLVHGILWLEYYTMPIGMEQWLVPK